MKVPFVFLLAGAVGAATVHQRAGCSADNCARAVTGTAKGSTRVVVAKSDCSSFLETTVTKYARYPTSPSVNSLSKDEVSTERDIRTTEAFPKLIYRLP